MQTTKHNLQGFINEVLEVLRGLDGLNYVPDNPELNPGIWPFVTVYMTNGTSKGTPAGYVQTDLTDVTIAMVVPLEDLAKAVDFLLPYREQIPMALYNHFYRQNNGMNSAHAQHLGEEITLNMSPISWPQGQEMFGYLITLNGVKIQNEVTSV